MGKLKFLIALGLCMVLLAFPITGMAENPFPVGHNADGHPWDDNTGGTKSDPGGPCDTTTLTSAPVVRIAYKGKAPGKPLLSIMRFVLTGKWQYLWY